MGNALVIDEAGKVYGDWTVLRPGRTERGGVFWVCRCACGVEREVYGATLRNGRSKSCGHTFGPDGALIPAAPLTGLVKRPRRCSVCGQPGHRFESCPIRPVGMTIPPKRPSTQADRARASGNEPPAQTKPRAGRTWTGHLEPVEGFEGLALRKIDRLQSEARATSRKPAYKLEDSTPLTEVLHDWKARYGLTPEESEVLFNVALDVLPSHRLAPLLGVSGDEIHARGLSVATKTETRSVTHTALALVREALAFATFDWEARMAKRGKEEGDNEEDDDGERQR